MDQTTDQSPENLQRCDRCALGCSGHAGRSCSQAGCRCREPRHRGLPASDKQAEPGGWGTRLRLASPQRSVSTVAGGILLPASFDQLAPIPGSHLESCERAIRLLADLLYDRDRQAKDLDQFNDEADRESQALRRLADGMLRQVLRVEEVSLPDHVVRAVRDEARAAGDLDRARCCSAALGLPTGDGAGGLLDRDTCRQRVAAIVRNNLSCGLDTYGARAASGGGSP